MIIQRNDFLQHRRNVGRGWAAGAAVCGPLDDVVVHAAGVVQLREADHRVVDALRSYVGTSSVRDV